MSSFTPTYPRYEPKHNHRTRTRASGGKQYGTPLDVEHWRWRCKSCHGALASMDAVEWWSHCTEPEHVASLGLRQQPAWASPRAAICTPSCAWLRISAQALVLQHFAVTALHAGARGGSGKVKRTLTQCSVQQWRNRVRHLVPPGQHVPDPVAPLVVQGVATDAEAMRCVAAALEHNIVVVSGCPSVVNNLLHVDFASFLWPLMRCVDALLGQAVQAGRLQPALLGCGLLAARPVRRANELVVALSFHTETAARAFVYLLEEGDANSLEWRYTRFSEPHPMLAEPHVDPRSKEVVKRCHLQARILHESLVDLLITSNAQLPSLQYQGPVIEVRNASQWASALRLLCGGQSLEQVEARDPPLYFGVDTEWKPERRKGEYNPAALLQLASHSCVVLVRLLFMKHMPRSLRRFLSSPDVRLVMQACQQDAFKLHKDYGVQLGGVVDLQDHSLVMRMKKRSLASLCVAFLGRRMSKDARMSNWAVSRLSPDQLAYAALDPIATLLVWERLRGFEFDATTGLVRRARVGVGVEAQ